MIPFFTSDTHFGHGNVIKYSNRPFHDAEEMDEALIANWNAKVPHNGTVFHLGDFAFRPAPQLIKILKRLNGKKIFIKGNHDKNLLGSPEARAQFESIHDYYELKVPDPRATRGTQLIVMCHYPMITWNKSHHGSWCLHGHCHGTLRYPYKARILDVGVDVHNYAPISYEELHAIMATKTPEFPDHHRGD